MATDHCTDRDVFGHWLSGLTDGEGCFYLGLHRHKGHRWPRPHADLSIALRQDDLPMLREIRAFLGIGVIWENMLHRRGKPNARLQITKVREMIEVVIPHFERYPLRSKKAGDFVIWKEGVQLLWAVQCRFRIRKPGQRGGRHTPWTEEERDEFRRIMERLREGRKFQAPDAVACPRPTPPQGRQGVLFP